MKRLKNNSFTRGIGQSQVACKATLHRKQHWVVKNRLASDGVRYDKLSKVLQSTFSYMGGENADMPWAPYQRVD
jgi:hypothetical protein